MNVQLTVVQGKPQGQALSFGPGEFVIGRGPECHVRPNSEWVSRQHCIMRVTGASVHLKDLGSTNGTLVNGARLVGEQQLQFGDVVQIGPLILRLADLAPNIPPQTIDPKDTAVISQMQTKTDMPV